MLISIENLSKAGEINTKTIYHGTCDNCGTEFRRQYKLHIFNKEKFSQCDMCKHCWCSYRFSGELNPAYGKTYRTKETHPEWAEKVSKTGKERKINSGNKNGMKRPDVAARMSKTRRERVTSDPEYRRLTSERMCKAWADGKYIGVKTGKCKWYDHIKPDGSTIKLQGTWEVAYARYLDENNIKYEAHRGRIEYKDHENNIRSYYPDFYLPDEERYVDVKGAFWDDQQRDKFKYILSSNSDIKIDLLTGPILESLGINLNSIQSELLHNNIQ